jgi:hypothetical protein
LSGSEYPALATWRAELGAGLRTAHTFDALYHAASAEVHALEAEAAGLPGIAARYRLDAREIIRRAAREGG